MKLASILFAATALSSACSGSAAAGDLTTIALHNGNNAIHLSGDGAAGMALLGRRENFNAHGFDVLTLYLKGTARPDAPDNWHLVSMAFSKTKCNTFPVRCRHGENLQTSDYPGARGDHDHARRRVLHPIYC